MPELTIGEWIGFAAMLSLVVVAVMAVGPLCDGFKRDIQRGLYSSSIPEVDVDPWQSIETAPKDGSDIIVGFEIASVWVVHVAWWRSKNDMPDFTEDDEGWWSYTRGSVTQEKLEGNKTPTHWLEGVAPMPKREEIYDLSLYNLAIDRGWTLPSVNDSHGAAAWNRYWADREKAERGELQGRPVAPHRSGGGHNVNV